MKKAIIFDRDGTIIYNKHYLFDPEGVELIEGTQEGFKIFSKFKNFLFFLHTNQSGVNRGYFNLEDVHKVNERMFQKIGVNKRFFKRICIAPEIEYSDQNYRKPSIKFIDEVVKDYNINYSDIAYVGDSKCDYEISKRTGCLFFEINIGKTKSLTKNPFKSIHEVAKYIENNY